MDALDLRPFSLIGAGPADDERLLFPGPPRRKSRSCGLKGTSIEYERREGVY